MKNWVVLCLVISGSGQSQVDAEVLRNYFMHSLLLATHLLHLVFCLIFNRFLVNWIFTSFHWFFAKRFVLEWMILDIQQQRIPTPKSIDRIGLHRFYVRAKEVKKQQDKVTSTFLPDILLVDSFFFVLFLRGTFSVMWWCCFLYANRHSPCCHHHHHHHIVIITCEWCWDKEHLYAAWHA